MSNIMIPFNNQPVETKRLEGSVGTNTYTVPAGKYARISLNVNWGGRAKVTYASDSGSGAQTILYARPDTKESDMLAYNPAFKADYFSQSASITATAGNYASLDLQLPGDRNDITTTYFRVRHTSGTSPQVFSYFTLYHATDGIGGVEFLPAHVMPAARGTTTASSHYFNENAASAEPVQLPGSTTVRVRFQGGSPSTQLTLDAYGTIVTERKFNALSKEIWLVEGDILHLDVADWDGATAYAHIEEYNVQS